MPRPLTLLLSLISAYLLALPAAASGPLHTYFWHPEIAPSGPVVIVVSLEEQRLYAYRNGVAIGISPVSSGKPGYDTPPGVYTILQKERMHHSNLYDDAPMPYMQRLTWGGVAMHGGVVRSRPASHGCIRLPDAFARHLFGVTRRGDVVVVSGTRVAPAMLQHPAAVAPIDLDGHLNTLLAAGAGSWLDIAPDTAPLSVVVSLHDRTTYVLADGRLIGRAPIAISSPATISGTLLYVMQPTDQERRDTHVWSAYRIRGHGAVPDPGRLAHELALPPGFGDRLQGMLAPGTTVLVTDLPGVGGTAPPPLQALLQSDNAPPPHSR